MKALSTRRPVALVVALLVGCLFLGACSTQSAEDAERARAAELAAQHAEAERKAAAALQPILLDVWSSNEYASLLSLDANAPLPVEEFTRLVSKLQAWQNRYGSTNNDADRLADAALEWLNLMILSAKPGRHRFGYALLAEDARKRYNAIVKRLDCENKNAMLGVAIDCSP